MFRRSKLSPVVFVVAPDHCSQVDQILEDLGLPNPTGGLTYISVTSLRLLDGRMSAEELVTGTLPSSTGSWAPGRRLCDLLGVDPPRDRWMREQPPRRS